MKKKRLRVRFPQGGICSTGKVGRNGCRWLPVAEANMLIGARAALLAMPPDNFAGPPLSNPPGGAPDEEDDE